MGMPRGFSAALRNADPKKLDQRIMSGGQMQRYLGEGDHDCKVVGMDRNQLEQNKLTIKWADDSGCEHRDMLWLTAEDQKTGNTELSWRFLATLGCLIPQVDAYQALLAELESGNDEVLDLLVGLLGKLVMKLGKAVEANVASFTAGLAATKKPQAGTQFKSGMAGVPIPF